MDYKGKKILLTAFSVVEGSEARAVYEYLISNGADDITTFYWGDSKVKDLIPDSVKTIKIDSVNDFDSSITKGFDLVFRHAPTRPSKIDSSVETTSLTQTFFDTCQAPIIGVTGTKGKGTTATLITRFLREDGKKAHLLGNIGTPALRALDQIGPDELVVYELSSFQLWDLNKSPHIAVVLMVEPDHLDIHKDMQDYVAAKSNICRFQTEKDLALYHPSNQLSWQVAQAGEGAKHPYMNEINAHIRNDKLMLKEDVLMSVGDIELIGRHNLENICAAISAVKHIVKDRSVYKKVLTSFSGLEHRLQLVATKDGVKFIDDSISTIPSTAIAAINAFNSPVIPIIGGSDKGVEYDDLVDEITSRNPKRVVTIGGTGRVISEALKTKGYEQVIGASSMQEAVVLANEVAEAGDIVLLSPGSASFGMFKNYKDRAQKFIDEIEKL